MFINFFSLDLTLFLFAGPLFELVDISKYLYLANFFILWTVKYFCRFAKLSLVLWIVPMVSIFHFSVECDAFLEAKICTCVWWACIGSGWINHQTECELFGMTESIIACCALKNLHTRFYWILFLHHTHNTYSHGANPFKSWTPCDNLDNVVRVSN